LYTNKITIVIEPLIAIMTDQDYKMNDLGINALILNSDFTSLP